MSFKVPKLNDSELGCIKSWWRIKNWTPTGQRSLFFLSALNVSIYRMLSFEISRWILPTFAGNRGLVLQRREQRCFRISTSGGKVSLCYCLKFVGKPAECVKTHFRNKCAASSFRHLHRCIYCSLPTPAPASDSLILIWGKKKGENYHVWLLENVCSTDEASLVWRRCVEPLQCSWDPLIVFMGKQHPAPFLCALSITDLLSVAFSLGCRLLVHRWLADLLFHQLWNKCQILQHQPRCPAARCALSPSLSLHPSLLSLPWRDDQSGWRVSAALLWSLKSGERAREL